MLARVCEGAARSCECSCRMRKERLATQDDITDSEESIWRWKSRDCRDGRRGGREQMTATRRRQISSPELRPCIALGPSCQEASSAANRLVSDTRSLHLQLHHMLCYGCSASAVLAAEAASKDIIEVQHPYELVTNSQHIAIAA